MQMVRCLVKILGVGRPVTMLFGGAGSGDVHVAHMSVTILGRRVQMSSKREWDWDVPCIMTVAGTRDLHNKRLQRHSFLFLSCLACVCVSECVARGKSSHNEAILRRPRVSAGEDTLEVPKFGAGYSVRARLFIPVRDLTMSQLYARKRVDHRVPSRDSDLFR